MHKQEFKNIIRATNSVRLSEIPEHIRVDIPSFVKDYLGGKNQYVDFKIHIRKPNRTVK
jgi:hypothetical protein